MSLVDALIKEGWLRTPRIIQAFKKIKREDFLTEETKGFADLNEPLSIGFEQTISQPAVVAFILEKLQPEAGDKILDIGSGSGWTTALLSEIVGEEGKVIGIEIIPELAEFGRKNISKYTFLEKERAEIICTDGGKGLEKEAPFDKILCSAAAQDEIPLSWKNQLKIGGKIVAPKDYSIWLLIKKAEGDFEEIEYPGFSFVPLVRK